MQGFGVNTYKMANADGDTVLVEFHWQPKVGVAGLSQAEADQIQGTDLGHATRDLLDAIDRGDYPEWELLVQIMSDDEHPELDFDPLDDTKTWPEDHFPLRSMGRMVLNRAPENFFAENEQIAMGTGVIVDGAGESPHVNYEPSALGGLREGTYPTHDKQGPAGNGSGDGLGAKTDLRETAPPS